MPGDYVRITNNRIELMAVIVGLGAPNRPCEVQLYSDSKYLTDALNQRWIDSWTAKGWNRGKNGPVKDIGLWKHLLKTREPRRVGFIWVKGHADHPQNERYDRLATSTADGSELMIDEDLKN